MANRRYFLKSITLLSGVLAASSLRGDPFTLKAKKMKTGIQLWTLRDEISADLSATLATVARIGYNSIEAYGFDGSFYQHTAKEFRNMCNDLGLEITSTHCNITASNASLYAEKAAEAGLRYLVLPSFNGRPEKTTDDFKRAAAEMNQVGEITQKAGITFGYHNHNFEFLPIEGRLPYDVLLAETDPHLVAFEMDIFWVLKGGQNPSNYFNNHPGRFKLWHIKDLGNNGESCIVGNGQIKFRELINQAEEAGLQNIFYEQEQYAEGTPVHCAQQSYNYYRRHLR